MPRVKRRLTLAMSIFRPRILLGCAAAVVLLVGVALEIVSPYSLVSFPFRFHGVHWRIAAFDGRIFVDDKPQQLFEAEQREISLARYQNAMERGMANPAIKKKLKELEPPWVYISERDHQQSVLKYNLYVTSLIPPQPGGNAIFSPLLRYSIPLHLLVFVSALGVVPMMLQIMVSLRRLRRLRNGQCPDCGYDLRASPSRCPECGSVPVRNAISN
jgi:hypothetical protein